MKLNDEFWTMLVLHLFTGSFFDDEEQSFLLCLLITSSCRYKGALLVMHLYIIMHVLNTIHSCIGSQCRSFRASET